MYLLLGCSFSNSVVSFFGVFIFCFGCSCFQEKGGRGGGNLSFTVQDRGLH